MADGSRLGRDGDMAGGLSRFLSRILGGAASRGGGDTADEKAEEEYKGYTIRPAPFQDGGQWITSGVIEKRFADEVKLHLYIRADMYPGREAAAAASLFKARQIIDMIGDDVFAQDGE